MGRARGAVRVPGVKLRPANPNAAQSKKNVIVSDDEEEVADPRLMQVGRDIFRGIVVCATGIRNKRDVFSMVRSMGGNHSTDFTDLTTHLIADETGSEKYRCAIVRNIPVVTTSWIEETYERWIHGDVFILEDTVDPHRLLPFRGMKICITGIETADVRARIHKLAKQYGGEYLKNLDKTCTHLLCAVDSSGKIEWANKNNAEREVMRARADGRFVPPSIYLLWEEWFWDCVHRQGLLPYDDYYITRPRPEPMSRSVMNSPEVLINPLPAVTSRSLPPPLPLASLLVDAGDPALPVKRKKDAAGKQWDSIIKRHTVTAANKSIHNASMDSSHMHIDGESYPSESASPMKKAWETGSNAIPAAPGWSRRSPVKKSTTASGSNNASGISKKISAIKLPPDSVETSKQSTFLGKFKRTAAFDEVERPQQSEIVTPIDTPTEPTPRRPKIFTGLNFILLGEAECEIVTGALEQAGGRVLTNGAPHFFIVRLVGGAKYMLERSTVEHSKFRTECWLERCLFEKRICSTEENVTYVPLVVSSSPEDTSNLLVTFSGLDSFERTWVSRLLRGLGIKLSLNFSSHCTHLLCPSREGIKCVKAKEWNIPIVGFDWVIERGKAAALQVSDKSKSPTYIANDIANEGDDGNLKVAKSMEDMYLEKDIFSRPALPEGATFSPVFKISSRDPVVVNGRPPSPTSPSPQRKYLVSNTASSTTTPPKSTSDVSKLPRQSSSKPFPTLSTSNVRSNTNPPENSIKSMIPTPTTSAMKLGKSPFNPPVTQTIPSSATPSPLATRSIGGSAIKLKEDLAFEPSSSGLLSLQSASAKALSRNIGAILGSKRAAEDDLDAATSSATSGAEGPRKRPRRPQPSRSTHSEGFIPRKLGSVPPVNLHENDEESQHSMATELPSAAVGGLAVNYSDPTEVEERRRLLMLINKSEGAAADPETSGKRAIKLGPRKSARQRGNHV